MRQAAACIAVRLLVCQLDWQSYSLQGTLLAAVALLALAGAARAAVKPEDGAQRGVGVVLAGQVFVVVLAGPRVAA